MTVLTYKIRVDRQFKRLGKDIWYAKRKEINKYLRTARKIAQYSIDHKTDKITSKTVKNLGEIPSCISNQIIKKYKNNFKCNKITNVNLIIPACSTVKYPSITHTKKVLTIKPLKMTFRWTCPIRYAKINQVELNNKYCYITLTTNENYSRKYKNIIGVDMNVKHNLAAVGNPDTKNIEYLGRDHIYQRSKYVAIRKRWQKQGRMGKIKQMGNKEYRVMNDINQKVSCGIINSAVKQNANIAIEDLKGIRSTKTSKKFGALLHSWAFYRLRLCLQYKCDNANIKLIPVDPKYTSQDCSECGARTKANGKLYKCKECGLEIHRDENASYNIANRAKYQA